MVAGVLQEQEQVDGSMVPPFKQTFPVQSTKLIILIMLFFKYINHTMPLMLLSTTSNITMMIDALKYANHTNNTVLNYINHNI